MTALRQLIGEDPALRAFWNALVVREAMRRAEALARRIRDLPALNYGGLRRNGGCAPPDGLCERPARSIDPPAPSAPSGAQAPEPPLETEDTEEADLSTGVIA